MTRHPDVRRFVKRYPRAILTRTPSGYVVARLAETPVQDQTVLIATGWHHHKVATDAAHRVRALRDRHEPTG